MKLQVNNWKLGRECIKAASELEYLNSLILIET